MASILRITNVIINSSSSISIAFTENLTLNLVPANISIIPENNKIPTPQVLTVSVSGNNLTITCQPLTPLEAYTIQLQSTLLNPFISINGDAQISQDGISNIYVITGPMDPNNPLNNYLQAWFQNNIYNVQDPTTVTASYLNSISTNFARALYDIRQVKNENYLSYSIIDELHVRGTGPFDRLNEEAAYDVFRVGS